MRQYDVCRLKAKEQLIVVLQHDVMDLLNTRIVAPLSPASSDRHIDKVRIPVEIDGGRYLLCLDRLAAIDKSQIGNVIDNFSDLEFGIKGGLDFAFFGV